MRYYLLSCNNQPKADKNMDDDAILIENAKVRDEKASDTKTRSTQADSIKTDSVRDENE